MQGRPFEHDCPADHISEWLGAKRTFRARPKKGLFGKSNPFSKYGVTLWFTPDPLNPSEVPIGHIKLAGEHEGEGDDRSEVASLATVFSGSTLVGNDAQSARKTAFRHQ